ncbi:MAG: glycosyltransferase family 2 protein [Endomicrobiales bacterium]
MPKVSVIIPAYNNGAYLPESIESVLRQTCRDLEILVVDDGSTDNTREVAQRYALKDPGRVRYVYQQNRGPGAARNRGIAEARGEYLAFLDADDRWLSTKLEKQAAILDSRPDTGLVYTDLLFFDNRHWIVGHASERKYRLPRGDITLFFFFRYFMVTSSVMVRAAVTRAAGLFREDIFVGEDYDYWLRVSALTKAEVIREELLAKRYRPDSLSNLDGMLNSKNDLLIFTEFLKKNPAFFRRNRRVLSRVLGKRSFTLGYFALRSGYKAFSIPFLLMAMRYGQPLKAAKCLALALLPFRLMRGIRKRLRGMETETILLDE